VKFPEGVDGAGEVCRVEHLERGAVFPNENLSFVQGSEQAREVVDFSGKLNLHLHHLDDDDTPA
jgi:hypothetical protein